MAIIKFSERDRHHPFDSDPVLLRIEEAPLCDGEDCGQRVFLSEEEQLQCGYRNPEPLTAHYHLVLSGEDPPARLIRYPVFSK